MVVGTCVGVRLRFVCGLSVVRGSSKIRRKFAVSCRNLHWWFYGTLQSEPPTPPGSTRLRRAQHAEPHLREADARRRRCSSRSRRRHSPRSVGEAVARATTHAAGCAEAPKPLQRNSQQRIPQNLPQMPRSLQQRMPRNLARRAVLLPVFRHCAYTAFGLIWVASFFRFPSFFFVCRSPFAARRDTAASLWVLVGWCWFWWWLGD